MRTMDLLGVIIFGAGLIFCGAVISFAVMQLTIAVWDLWRDWYRDRRRNRE